MGNLDYVTCYMQEVMKNDPENLEELKKVYIGMREQEKRPGYYGRFDTYQDMLNYYKADDHDDMISKIYNY